MDNLSNPFDNVILDDISDYPIKPGDRVYVESERGDVEGVAMFAIFEPYMDIIAIREDDGNEIRVRGDMASLITVNDIEI